MLFLKSIIIVCIERTGLENTQNMITSPILVTRAQSRDRRKIQIEQIPQNFEKFQDL